MIANARRLVRLDDHREMCKAPVVQQPLERMHADMTFADVLVPIEPAAARPLRVVCVHDAQPIESDDAVEVREGVLVASLARNVVTGRE